MRIGLDLDGVVYNFHASMRHYVHNYVGVKRTLPNPTVWNYFDQWGMTAEEWLKHFDDGVSAGVVFSYGNPMTGSQEMVRRLVEDGHSIHVITDRSRGLPGVAAASTVGWLTKHFPPKSFASITFSVDKTIVKTDTMIDDKLENYESLTDAGCNAVLLNRPWNQDPKYGYNDGRNRVDSLDEFTNLVLQKDLVLA